MQAPSPDLKFLSVIELKNLARQRGLSGYSRLNRADLISSLQQSSFTSNVQQSPPKSISLNIQLESLPQDMQLEILSHLTLPELLNYCNTNKQLASLCKSELLWEKMVKRDYPDRPKGDLSWRENYIKAYQSMQLIPYIDAHWGLNRFLAEEFVNLNWQVNYNFKTSHKSQIRHGNQLRNLDQERQNNMIKYYNLTQNEKTLQQLADTPIPNLHHLIVDIFKRGNHTSLYHEDINQYDITLRDLYHLIERVRATNISSNKYLYSFDVDLPNITVRTS